MNVKITLKFSSRAKPDDKLFLFLDTTEFIFFKFVHVLYITADSIKPI